MISRLRILVFAAVCAAGVGAFFAFPASSPGAQWILILALLVVGVPLLLVSAEADERYGQEPSPRGSSWIGACFVPGSGRGSLFALVALLIVLLSFLGAHRFHQPDQPLFGDDDPTQLATICLFVLSYCCSVALLTRRLQPGVDRSKRLGAVILCALLAVPVTAALTIVLPDEAIRILEGLVIPQSLLKEVRQDGRWTANGWIPFLVLCCITAILFLANLPRMLGGLMELGKRNRQSSAVRA